MIRPSYFKTVRDRRAKTLTPAVLSRLEQSQQTQRGMEKISRLKQQGEDIRLSQESYRAFLPRQARMKNCAQNTYFSQVQGIPYRSPLLLFLMIPVIWALVLFRLDHFSKNAVSVFV